MIQSINFPICSYCIAPYGSWDALGRKIRALGLDGIEGIVDPVDLDTTFPKELLAGYHLVFYPDWLDFWRQDEAKLLQKFGSWEVLERAGNAKSGARLFLCRCQCGTERLVTLHNLTTGKSKSCGCGRFVRSC